MTNTTGAVVLGEGVLNWSRYERISGRYGAIHLAATPCGEDYVTWEDAPAAQFGTLAAVILETRPSSHIGDWARGIGPSEPGAGEEIPLGTGTLFTWMNDGVPRIGLEPGDGRDHDWLDPRGLYRCHEQTVRLIFTPAEREGT